MDALAGKKSLVWTAIPLLFAITGLAAVLKPALLLAFCLAFAAFVFLYVRLGLPRLLLFGVCAVIILPPANFWPGALTVGPLNPLNLTVFAAFAAALLFKGKDEHGSARKAPYLGIFAVFLLALLVSAFAAEYPAATLYQVFRFLTGSLLVYMGMHYLLTDKKRLEFVISVSIGCFSVMSALAIIEYILEDNFIFHTLLHQPMPNLSFYRVYRSYSTTALPNVLACLNVTILPLFVYRLHTAAGASRKWLYGLLFALQLASLYCTMSRTSWLALALIALLYLAFRRNKLRTLSLVAAAALFVWGFVLPSLQGSAAAEKLSLRLSPEQVVDTGSYWHRMYKFKSAVLILKHSPYIGIGFGNYPLVSGENRYLDSGDPNALNTFDNTYLKIVSETGLIGLILFLLLIGAVTFSVARGFAQGRGPYRLLCGAVLLSLIAFLLISAVLETFFWNSLNIWFWTIAVIGMKAAKLARSDRSADRQAAHGRGEALQTDSQLL